MKFLALSAIAALGFLAQDSESTLIGNNLFSNLGLNNPIQNLQGSNPLFSGSTTGFSFGQQEQQKPNGFGSSVFQQGNPFGLLNQNVGPINLLNQNPSNLINQAQNLPNINGPSPFDNLIPFNNNDQNPLNNLNPFNNNQNQNYFDNNDINFQFNHNQVSSEIIKLRSINRSFDGTGNNLKNPQWGSAGSPLQRLCPANYQDGKSVMWKNVPEPREISNFVGQVPNPIRESSLGNNMLFTIWGQFLDHDMSLSLPSQGNSAQVMSIQIPKCDFAFDKKCTGKERFPFTRSSHTGAPVRTNVNILTAWIDGSQVYGSSKQTADSLREFKNGKMKVSKGNLLPKNDQGQFLAGDFRVDENVGLTIFHTVFVREHNRLCDLILKIHSKLSDEEVYQMARHYVIGLLQHITFDEYLPELIGRKNMNQLVGSYKYDENAKPNIFTEFSAAAFRIGHPLINSPIRTTDNSGKLIKSVPLREMFFNPALVTVDGVNQFFNGLIRTAGKQRSIELVDDVRNFLSFPPVSATIDLFAFNIQRGRDHGICSIKGARQRLGLPNQSIREVFEDQEKAKLLQLAYHNIDNVDLWLGIIGEKKRPDAVLGELGMRLNAFQFTKIRNGDRFWYESAYPKEIVREIKATSFGDIIRRNTEVTSINRNPFKKV